MRLIISIIICALSLMITQGAFAGNSIKVFVDDVELSTEVSPVLHDGSVLVPLRSISKMLNADTHWDAEKQTAILVSGNLTIGIKPGAPVAEAGGQEHLLDVPARISNGRLLVPLRFVGEALGCDVKWDARGRKVDIHNDFWSRLMLRGPVRAEELGLKVDAPTPGIVTTDSKILLDGKIDDRLNGRIIYAGVSKGEFIRCQSAIIADGQFSAAIWLPYGPGEYEIRLSIKEPFGFEILNDNTLFKTGLTNTDPRDLRYLTPNLLIDCDSPEIVRLSQWLIAGKDSEWEKVKAIHDWVATNIAYNTRGLNYAGAISTPAASRILLDKEADCHGYSVLTAALLRSIGIPARIVSGNIRSESDGRDLGGHAWNEVFLDQRWVSIDVSWNAGFVSGDEFRFALRHKYFDPEPQVFTVTHRRESIETW